MRGSGGRGQTAKTGQREGGKRCKGRGEGRRGREQGGAGESGERGSGRGIRARQGGEGGAGAMDQKGPRCLHVGRPRVGERRGGGGAGARGQDGKTTRGAERGAPFSPTARTAAASRARRPALTCKARLGARPAPRAAPARARPLLGDAVNTGSPAGPAPPAPRPAAPRRAPRRPCPGAVPFGLLRGLCAAHPIRWDVFPFRKARGSSA